MLTLAQLQDAAAAAKGRFDLIRNKYPSLMAYLVFSLPSGIGGIVEHAGYGCPLETPQIEAAADQDGSDMRELVKAIANQP